MSADKSPVEKLPLAARKSIRDGWEAKKGALEEQVSALLGVPWKFEVNPNAIFPYAEADSYGQNSPGDCIFAYFDAFLYSLKNSFIEYHGDSGKEELNNVCPSHTVTLLASPKFSYCGSDVQDGQFRLLFHPDKLGTNINDVAQKIAEALSAAPQPEGASTLSYAARHSIKTEYTTKIVPVLEKAQKLLQNPKLEFQPGFEALGAKLKSGKDVRDDWETNLGNFATKYFEGFVDVLEREKFGEDDLLREGFEEGVPKGIVQLKLVDALKNGGYNETLLEDGALTIQTTPDRWGTNIHYSCEKLVEIL
ncbi:hypothetical protein L207DRAFT_477714 [Hyaloscypha variabilis F]|uniref:Uncharacterized protein n=1 Tax=Hyaloscypha variabilis (strain UAMH 11265 / GT02V1 / F) TaxID=1149755 RepID=A0A2J6SE06_HYAVF|nr:hypothetical protein L207DRAFT_477714 [Hyaloscypha variabilis F]